MENIVVSDGILFGFGLGIWVGYFVPRFDELVNLFKQGSTIMVAPPKNIIIVYGVGLFNMTMALVSIHSL